MYIYIYIHYCKRSPRIMVLGHTQCGALTGAVHTHLSHKELGTEGLLFRFSAFLDSMKPTFLRFLRMSSARLFGVKVWPSERS